MRRTATILLIATICGLLALDQAWVPGLQPVALAQGAGGKTPEWEQKYEVFPHHFHRWKARPDNGCQLCHKAGTTAEGGELRYVTLENCDTCHQPGKEEVRVEKSDVEATVMFSGFDHTLHVTENNLSCSLCHFYNKGKEAGSHSGKPRIKIFEDGFRTPTIRNCRGCHIWPHEQHDTAKPVFQHPEENCVDCHLTQVVEAVPAEAKPAPDAEGRKAFSHIRHVGGHEIPRDDMALCLRCHQQADTSTSIADGKLKGLSEEACFSCHGLPAGKTMGEVVVAQERTLQPHLAEFPHQTHVKALGSCTKCHSLGENDTWGWSPDSGGLPGYSGCISCHSSWNVPDHEKSKGRGPIRCAACHTGNSENRAELRLVEFQKQRLGKLSFGKSAHPYICRSPSGKNAKTPEDCASCHRQQTDFIVSRVKDKPFSHAAHFSAEQRGKTGLTSETALSCEKCHGGISGSSDAASSGDIDLENACSSCHLGSGAPTAVEAKVIAVSAPPGFSHKSHLGYDEISSCRDCHAFDSANDQMLTKTTAASCVQCHAHDGGRAMATGPSDLGRCNSCHIGDSIFASSTPVTITKPTSSTIHARLDKHHETFTGNCNQCHAANGGKGQVVTRRGIQSISHVKFEHPSPPDNLQGDVFKEFCNKCHISPKG